MHVLYPSFPPHQNWKQKVACDDGEKKQYTLSLSFTAHLEIEALLAKRVSELGISRGEYVCNLIKRDLNPVA